MNNNLLFIDVAAVTRWRSKIPPHCLAVLVIGNYSSQNNLKFKNGIYQKQNAVFVFFEEYKKAIIELQYIIADINEVELLKIVDTITSNSECKSIQTILTHVISSGYSYCVIQNHWNIDNKRPAQKIRLATFEYLNDLDKVLEFTNQTFSAIYDNELEEFNNSKKIISKRGEYYDIEQMMEHAIVHIFRYRRQIRNFKKIIRSS